jgi:hypothetical protein
MYASFLGISEALHMDIFHQPLKSGFFHTLLKNLIGSTTAGNCLQNIFSRYAEDSLNLMAWHDKFADHKPLGFPIQEGYGRKPSGIY